MAGSTYTFHLCLGRGGFGEVYLATRHQPGGLDTRVAVKVLKNGLQNEATAVKRLRDEGRMLAVLAHPAILGILEMTRLDTRIALVMEYVEGVDLARCCKKDFLLPPRVILGVIGDVAAALDNGLTTISPDTGKPLQLIHRDIKPENIRLSKHGEVKLLDFGIARSYEMTREAKTAAGDLPFTPGYTAPEGYTEGIQNAATDVFALGVTMYRLLVGDRFYEGVKLPEQVTMAASPKRYEEYLLKRLALVASAPEPVVALVRSMLSYDPAGRPTARQVQHRAETLADEVAGPTHVRWARNAAFPEPKGLDGGTFTGRTLSEDLTTEAVVFQKQPTPAPVERRETGGQRRPTPTVPPPTGGHRRPSTTPPPSSPNRPISDPPRARPESARPLRAATVPPLEAPNVAAPDVPAGIASRSLDLSDTDPTEVQAIPEGSAPAPVAAAEPELADEAPRGNALIGVLLALPVGALLLLGGGLAVVGVGAAIVAVWMGI